MVGSSGRMARAVRGQQWNVAGGTICDGVGNRWPCLGPSSSGTAEWRAVTVLGGSVGVDRVVYQQQSGIALRWLSQVDGAHVAPGTVRRWDCESDQPIWRGCCGCGCGLLLALCSCLQRYAMYALHTGIAAVTAELLSQLALTE